MAAGVATAMIVILGVTGSWTGAAAESDDDAAQRAAREIQAARDRANQAAADYAEATFKLEELEERAAELEQQHAELEAEVEALREQVEQVAVSRFMSSGQGGIPILTGYRAPVEQLQTDVLLNVVSESSADAMDRFDEARAELEENRRELEANQAQLEAQREQFEAMRKAAEAEVKRLQEIEAKRLEEERVRKILEAQRREEQRRREEEERRQREAAARAAAEQAAREQAAREQAERERAQRERADRERAGQQAAAPPQAVGNGGGGGGGGDAAPAPPATNGGNAGGSGGSDAPAPAAPPPPPPPPPPPRSGIICPVRGAAYTDTWGAARSGGRSHQGVDMITHRGNPIYAVVSGYAQFKQNRLGGNAVGLKGDNGDYYYYAHLDRYEGSSRRVQQGEVIGYVGDTGNARGTPHLHFEVHPGGGAAVNPYPYVRDAGC